MKTNAIIRIILYCAVILVLVGILVCGLSFGLFSGRRSLSVSWKESGGTVTSSGSTNAAGIRELSIDWASGTITIQSGDTDSITYRESGASDSKYQMVVSESGGKLSIRYCQNDVLPGISIRGNLRKDLEIIVPRDWVCDQLEINVASADVTVTDLTIREVEFDGASGVCSFENCQVTDLDIDTASGDIRFTGTLNTLECDAASASLYAVLDNCPSRISMDSASGGLDLTLPSDAGFTLDKSTMSGDFFSDFPTTNQNGKHICGNGSCRIDFNAASGDISIRKGA